MKSIFNLILCVLFASIAAFGQTIYLNRDLSTGNLFQYTHRDWGLGTDVGSNSSGAGYLWYHPNIAGLPAAGMTATPTAHAQNTPSSSDAVWLWDPTMYWNYEPYDIWLHTSFMFPSAATITTSGMTGEAPYQPTTGEWNWFLTFHNDSNPLPTCAKEYGNLAFNIQTDDPLVSGNVGVVNPRMRLRIMGGDSCSPSIVYADGPALQRDHWYDFLVHIKWHESSGIAEWWVDNALYYSNWNIPTLYYRPAGYVSPSYTSLTLANYRWHAAWNSTIYLGPLLVGSTRDVVTTVTTSPAPKPRHRKK